MDSMIKVQCTTEQCEVHKKVQTVPRGYFLTSGIILTGTLQCAYCGAILKQVA